MAKDAFEYWIHPDLRATCAVYAVAMGEHQGLDFVTLKLIRTCVENSNLSGEERVDSVLLFIEGLCRHNTLGQFPIPASLLSAAEDGVRTARAYCDVAPLIQPLSAVSQED